MSQRISGLHHVTAITSDAQRNVDFYCGVLGLRLVKLTVNFDDPSSYHLYYGDELGRPGSIMTFFAWPGAYRGRIGQPQVTTTAFSIPSASLPFWLDRLRSKSIEAARSTNPFGDELLSFTDFDGTQLELVATDSSDNRSAWTGSDVPAAYGIRGFFGVTLSVAGYEATANMLIDTLGFQRGAAVSNRFRFTAGSTRAGSTGAGPTGAGAIVDIVCVPAGRAGSLGGGVVHHVAFRAVDDADQAEWLRIISQAGRNVSPVMDRTYFHSIYFREPGGVLFEIATDQPGFSADEPANSLGERLMLPPWMEKDRPAIERMVPPLKLPEKHG